MTFGTFDGCRVKPGPNYLTPFQQAVMRRIEAERAQMMATTKPANLPRSIIGQVDRADFKGISAAKSKKPLETSWQLLGQRVDEVMRANNVLLRDAAAQLGVTPRRARDAWRAWRKGKP